MSDQIISPSQYTPFTVETNEGVIIPFGPSEIGSYKAESYISTLGFQNPPDSRYTFPPGILEENNNYLKKPMPIYLASTFSEERKFDALRGGNQWIRSGTKVRPLGDYFKPNGKLPEFEYEGGEFSEITYAFDRVRLVPAKDSTGARQRIRIGDRIINGTWNLVADLHCKLVRYVQFPEMPKVPEDVLNPSSPFYDEVIANDVYRPHKETIAGILAEDVVLAAAKLLYRTRKCSQTVGKPDGIDYEWYFEIDEIETLQNLTIKQQSSRPGTAL